MSISMYQASVPAFVRGLTNLSAILDKAAADAEARKIDPAVLINSRLAPDMFPLARQIMIAADFAKGATARLAGVEVPKYEDNETTFVQFKARIDKTIAFVKSFKPSQVDGSEEKDISITVAGNPMAFKGLPYLVDFVLPNFYFHLACAYAILRHNGVPIGKRDFIGPK